MAVDEHSEEHGDGNGPPQTSGLKHRLGRRSFLSGLAAGTAVLVTAESAEAAPPHNHCAGVYAEATYLYCAGQWYICSDMCCTVCDGYCRTVCSCLCQPC
jgi:hypothetical protein